MREFKSVQIATGKPKLYGSSLDFEFIRELWK